MSAAQKAGRELQAKWRRHVEAWQMSGKSQAAYCREHGLGYYRFHYWKQKYGKAPDHQRLRLVPVTGLNADPLTDASRRDEVPSSETGLINAEASSSSKSGIRLLVGEVTIEIDREFDDGALALAIAVLRSLRCG